MTFDHFYRRLELVMQEAKEQLTPVDFELLLDDGAELIEDTRADFETSRNTSLEDDYE